MPGPKLIEGADKAESDRRIPDSDLGEFLLRMCHDLRSPTRAIQAHAELIQRGSTEQDFEQNFGFIVDGARRLDLLMDRVTSYSIALHIDPASFQRVRMDVVLRTALARLDAELISSGTQLTYSQLPSVSGNPDRLTQVFEELIRNGLRHGGPASSHIDITARLRGDEWLFAIADDGCGIEAAYLERIMKPFERLNAADRSGAGMGLPICLKIVERHGGSLWAESTPGAGSTFHFTLPAVSQ